MWAQVRYGGSPHPTSTEIMHFIRPRRWSILLLGVERRATFISTIHVYDVLSRAQESPSESLRSSGAVAGDENKQRRPDAAVSPLSVLEGETPGTRSPTGGRFFPGIHCILLFLHVASNDPCRLNNKSPIE